MIGTQEKGKRAVNFEDILCETNIINKGYRCTQN